MSRALFWILVLYQGLGATYSLAWGVADLLIRLSPTVADLMPPDMVDFVRRVGWGQELVFLMVVVLSCASLVLVLRRSPWLFASQFATVFFLAIDWVWAGWRGLEATSQSGLRGIIMGLGGLVLAYVVYTRGQLDRDRL